MAESVRIGIEAWITSQRALLMSQGKTRSKANEELVAKFTKSFSQFRLAVDGDNVKLEPAFDPK